MIEQSIGNLPQAEKGYRRPVSIYLVHLSSESRVVGQGLVEIVAQIPADAKAVGHNGHQLPFASQSLKEKNKLELEKYYRINARAPRRSVALLNQIPHKRELEGLFQGTVEVILRDEFFEGDRAVGRSCESWCPS